MQNSCTLDATFEQTAQVRRALDQLRSELLAERCEGGWWEGELSPSALSTATAVSAMSAVIVDTGHGESEPAAESEAVEGSLSEPEPLPLDSLTDSVRHGIRYLADNQNDDGGFGDTDRSHSNIATSYLVLAADALAFKAVGEGLADSSRESLRQYIEHSGGIAALRARYGKDKTFVVPILTNLAIAGLFDWDDVPALPFEAAVFPQSMYRLLRMPVVSYAIPALVAIGQTRHFHGRRSIWPLRKLRRLAIGRSMNVLRRMQPDSGGYLEATPLTSFVVMSLAVTGRSRHNVSRDGVRFLLDSMTSEGSWPIDTNLATWVTSLSMHALASDPDDDGQWCSDELIDWHLSCQHQQRHPFTGAEPGGWGWSDLSGAVPDSDDTPAAVIALCDARRWIDDPPRLQSMRTAIGRAVDWLSRLQNRDGGWPTFCRGWGKLPFDRSSNDLTAHALRAIAAATQMESAIGNPHEPTGPTTAMERGVRFLRRNQQTDGSWLPLWFGNQDRPQEDNPVYGTSRVLATATLGLLPNRSLLNGARYLLESQNEDGGWGGGPSVDHWLRRTESPADPTSTAPTSMTAENSEAGRSRVISSMEETALAVEALATMLLADDPDLLADGPDLFADESNRAALLAEADQNLHADRASSVADSPLTAPLESKSRDTSRNPQPHRSVESGSPTANNGSDFARRVSSESSDRALENALNHANTAGGKEGCQQAIIRGIDFLVRGVDRNQHRLSWPIGFYFAKLWYHERLYPLIFSTSALAKYLQWVEQRPGATAPPQANRVET